MATLVLPVTYDIAAYQFQIELEGTLYFFSFRYNSRMDRWVMNIADENEEILLAGLVLITNYNLLHGFKNDKLPPGKIFMYDETGEQKTSGRDEIGNTIKLFYVESIE